jgi:hypothetical protein
MNATPHDGLHDVPFVGAQHCCALSGDQVAAPSAASCSRGGIYPGAECIRTPLPVNDLQYSYRHSEERSDEESLRVLRPAGAVPQ